MHGVDVIYISVTMYSSHEFYDESKRRKKALWFLEFHWREQGQICSHTLHNVARGGHGIFLLGF